MLGSPGSCLPKRLKSSYAGACLAVWGVFVGGRCVFGHGSPVERSPLFDTRGYAISERGGALLWCVGAPWELDLYGVSSRVFEKSRRLMKLDTTREGRNARKISAPTSCEALLKVSLKPTTRNS